MPNNTLDQSLVDEFAGTGRLHRRLAFYILDAYCRQYGVNFITDLERGLTKSFNRASVVSSGRFLVTMEKQCIALWAKESKSNVVWVFGPDEEAVKRVAGRDGSFLNKSFTTNSGVMFCHYFEACAHITQYLSGQKKDLESILVSDAEAMFSEWIAKLGGAWTSHWWPASANTTSCDAHDDTDTDHGEVKGHISESDQKLLQFYFPKSPISVSEIMEDPLLNSNQNVNHLAWLVTLINSVGIPSASYQDIFFNDIEGYDMNTPGSLGHVGHQCLAKGGIMVALWHLSVLARAWFKASESTRQKRRNQIFTEELKMDVEAFHERRMKEQQIQDATHIAQDKHDKEPYLEELYFGISQFSRQLRKDSRIRAELLLTLLNKFGGGIIFAIGQGTGRSSRDKGRRLNWPTYMKAGALITLNS